MIAAIVLGLFVLCLVVFVVVAHYGQKLLDEELPSEHHNTRPPRLPR